MSSDFISQVDRECDRVENVPTTISTRDLTPVTTFASTNKSAHVFGPHERAAMSFVFEVRGDPLVDAGPREFLPVHVMFDSLNIFIQASLEWQQVVNANVHEMVMTMYPEYVGKLCGNRVYPRPNDRPVHMSLETVVSSKTQIVMERGWLFNVVNDDELEEDDQKDHENVDICMEIIQVQCMSKETLKRDHVTVTLLFENDAVVQTVFDEKLSPIKDGLERYIKSTNSSLIIDWDAIASEGLLECMRQTCVDEHISMIVYE